MRSHRVELVLGQSVVLWLSGAGCGEVKNERPDAGEPTADAGVDATTIDAPPSAVAPVNTSTAGTVAEEGTLPLTGLLLTTDEDTSAGFLTYTVRALPANGSLRRGAVALAVGSTFTQQEVNDGQISYVHDGSEGTADDFEWDLTDGSHMLPASGTLTLAITVTPVNDAPVIAVNTPTSVAEAGTQVLTTSQLMVTDAEGGTLTYTLLGITRGQLQKRVGAGSFAALAVNQTFTQQDIAAGNVRFVDSGVDDAQLAMKQNTTASFSWRVADGDGGFNPSANGSNMTTFTVTPVDDPGTGNFRPSMCYQPNTASPANPVQSVTDPDNVIADYEICVVSIGTGDSVNHVQYTTSSGGHTTATVTVTQIVPTVRRGTTVLGVGSCVPANATNVTFTTPANSYGGNVMWRLMKGGVQVSTNHLVHFVRTAPPC